MAMPATPLPRSSVKRRPETKTAMAQAMERASPSRSKDANESVVPIWRPPVGDQLDRELAAALRARWKELDDASHEVGVVAGVIGSGTAGTDETAYEAALCHMHPFAYTSQIYTTGAAESTQVDGDGNTITLSLLRRSDHMFNHRIERRASVLRRWPERSKEVDLYDIPSPPTMHVEEGADPLTLHPYERYKLDPELHLRLIERSEALRERSNVIRHVNGEVLLKHEYVMPIGCPSRIVRDLPPARDGRRPLGATTVDNLKGVCWVGATHAEDPDAWAAEKARAERARGRSRKSRRKKGKARHTFHAHRSLPIHRPPPSVQWFLDNPDGMSHLGMWPEYDDTTPWPHGIVATGVDRLTKLYKDKHEAMVGAAIQRFLQGEGDVPGHWTTAAKVLDARLKCAKQVHARDMEAVEQVKSGEGSMDAALGMLPAMQPTATPVQNRDPQPTVSEVERARRNRLKAEIRAGESGAANRRARWGLYCMESNFQYSQALQVREREEMDPFVGGETFHAPVLSPGEGRQDRQPVAEHMGHVDPRAGELIAGNDSEHRPRIDATRLGGARGIDQPAANDATAVEGEVISPADYQSPGEEDVLTKVIDLRDPDSRHLIAEHARYLANALNTLKAMQQKYTEIHGKVRYGVPWKHTSEWHTYNPMEYGLPASRVYKPGDTAVSDGVLFDTTIEDADQALDELIKAEEVRRRVSDKARIKRAMRKLDAVAAAGHPDIADPRDLIEYRRLSARPMNKRIREAMEFLSLNEKYAPLWAEVDRRHQHRARSGTSERKQYHQRCAAAARTLPTVEEQTKPSFMDRVRSFFGVERAGPINWRKVGLDLDMVELLARDQYFRSTNGFKLMSKRARLTGVTPHSVPLGPHKSSVTGVISEPDTNIEIVKRLSPEQLRAEETLASDERYRDEEELRKIFERPIIPDPAERMSHAEFLSMLGVANRNLGKRGLKHSDVLLAMRRVHDSWHEDIPLLDVG